MRIADQVQQPTKVNAAEFWRRSREVIERHTNALAEDLMAVFQEDVLQPYRDAGRPAEQRVEPAALAGLKPITVQGVVTAFGRAVNRTIRERTEMSREPAH